MEDQPRDQKSYGFCNCGTKSNPLICVNGHTVCNGCKGKLSGWCPTCRGVLGNIRCLSLEKVAASLQLPCKFQDKGCAEVLKYDEKEEHEKSCRFRPYRCPVRGCLTVGDVRKIVLHLEHEHQGSPVKEASEISHVFTEPLKHIEDSKRASDPLLYMFQDEYFCLHFEEQRNFLTTSTYSAYITFLGEPTDASKFKYRLEVGRHDRAMIWMGVPRSIRDSLDDITKSNDCLAIPKHLANYFSLGDMQELKLEVRGTIWEKDE
ncbi:hypothetical protein CBR_g12811 [Chara braunii]|uniref:E3 ubiquitin-protein ligase n=1 Tax=Chara braunii TaxID=69332 RepID=A0A388KSP4_CHABU|nr:hypothetical protein CBR_g12811 [Chara braunii]|eukprot:GBG73095.1 hypothetical protein CBR_g12811 [Chara braunii]